MRVLWTISLVLSALYLSVFPAIAGFEGGGFVAGGRSLLGFFEAQGNTTFRCYPSGPCIPCQYSEKNDEKYRCSETGYHLPLKCIEIQENKENNNNRRRLASLRKIEFSDSKLLSTINNFKWRKLLDDSSAQSSETGTRQYITYRSCVPVDGEEKLSVLGFEVLMLGLLLVSGPLVYIRQRHSVLMQGASIPAWNKHWVGTGKACSYITSSPPIKRPPTVRRINKLAPSSSNNSPRSQLGLSTEGIRPV